MIRHPEVPAHHTALTFSLRVNARASKDDGSMKVAAAASSLCLQRLVHL
jgi:hypothetical protein